MRYFNQVSLIYFISSSSDSSSVHSSSASEICFFSCWCCSYSFISEAPSGVAICSSSCATCSSSFSIFASQSVTCFSSLRIFLFSSFCASYESSLPALLSWAKRSAEIGTTEVHSGSPFSSFGGSRRYRRYVPSPVRHQIRTP